MNTIDTGATADSGSASVQERIQLALFGDEPEDQKKQPEDQPEGTDDGDETDGAPKVKATDVDDDDEGGATLASYLGLSEDQVFEAEDGKVYVNAKVDGEVTTVPFEEVIKSYQLQKHVNNKSMMVSEQQKLVAQEYHALREEAENRFHVLDRMVEALEQQFTSAYKGVDWQRLRVENPAEYVAAQQDYQNMMAGLQQAKQVTLDQRTQIQQIQAAKQQQEQAQYMANQAQLVLRDNPQWADPNVRAAETAAMRSFLASNYEYQDRELDAVNDFRMIRVIRDAMAYRQGKAVAEHKVAKPVPKFQKPGAVRNDMSKAREAKAVKGNLKRTGSLDDAAAALLSRM